MTPSVLPHRTSFAARAALLLVAALAAVWLAVGQRNVQDAQQALRDVRQTPPATASALTLASDQFFLNLGGDPLQIKAIVLWNAGERARAVAQLRTLVDQEPANRQAWSLLAYFLRRSDAAGAAEALRRFNELNGTAGG